MTLFFRDKTLSKCLVFSAFRAIFCYNFAMKLTAKTQQNQSDYSGLKTTELLAIIAEKEQCIVAQRASLKDQDKVLQNQSKIIRSHEKYIGLLEEQLRLASIQKFAAKSEKLAYQMDLFDEAELEQAIADIEDQLPNDWVEPAAPLKKKRTRGFSDSLKRVRVELTLTDAEKAGALRTFFTKVKEELEYIPAQLNVLEYWQEKAVFNNANGEDHILAAQRPVHPLGSASPVPRYWPTSWFPNTLMACRYIAKKTS